jgi:hypothetical protein
MAQYCTLEDLQSILPNTVVIGTNLQNKNVNVLESRALFLIEQGAGLIDSYITTIYRVPLMKYKEPDYSATNITFAELYPPPIVLINARLAAANIYDHIMMAQQTPNVSEWGKNQRALAFDDLKEIQTGAIQLKGQELIGLRFVRMELFDPSRLPTKPPVSPTNRQAGQ